MVTDVGELRDAILIECKSFIYLPKQEKPPNKFSSEIREVQEGYGSFEARGRGTRVTWEMRQWVEWRNDVGLPGGFKSHLKQAFSNITWGHQAWLCISLPHSTVIAEALDEQANV